MRERKKQDFAPKTIKRRNTRNKSLAAKKLNAFETAEPLVGLSATEIARRMFEMEEESIRQ